MKDGITMPSSHKSKKKRSRGGGSRLPDDSTMASPHKSNSKSKSKKKRSRGGSPPLDDLTVAPLRKSMKKTSRGGSTLLNFSTVCKYRESIANQTRFALRLARRVASTQASDSNLALSPLSIHHILSLVAAGAKGPTLEHFLSVLRSGGTDEIHALSSQIVALVLADGSARGGPRLSFRNGGWLDASLSLNPSFKEIATSTYKAEVKTVDFQTKAEEARCEVNSWVEKETSGLVKEILPSGSVDEKTRLVLANALYFKGAWDQKFFNASETKESEFYLLNGGSSVQVPFMTTKKKQYLEAYDGFKVLKLPYSDGEDERRFSMYIFLPDAQDGLWSLEERLCSESGFLDRHRPGRKAIVRRFKLPRFKISFRFEASQVLKDLGLVLPFDEEAADLTGMTDRRLCVAAIFHESVLEINEEGTEAAAATVVGGCYIMDRQPTPPPVLDFEADHPFLFLIREDLTGAVLFVGHVLNPLNTS